MYIAYARSSGSTVPSGGPAGYREVQASSSSTIRLSAGTVGGAFFDPITTPAPMSASRPASRAGG